MIPALRRIVATMLLVVPFAAFAAGPELSVKDFQGGESSLNTLLARGKWTVVMIWAHDCPICDREFPEISRFHVSHRNKDAVVLGVSLDGFEQKRAAQAFIDRHRPEFPNVIAEFDQLAAFYRELTGENWLGTPTFLIYDPKAAIAVKQVGPLPVDAVEEFIASRSVSSAGR
jgi:thiol-disulfide isomerase/thioredoxin